MVDTIVLLLSHDMYQINDLDKFVPSARWVANPTPALYGIQSKQNPTKKELLVGIYKPRLTLFHRFSHLGKQEIVLKIELSLPKLLFGNNFTELKYRDITIATQKLTQTLETMGSSRNTADS